jgi:hypothetical protein
MLLEKKKKNLELYNITAEGRRNSISLITSNYV